MEEKKNIAIIDTELGEITIELYDNTPKHRDNFIKLTGEKFYNGLLFHRVMPNFMIQGGDPKSKEARPGQNLGAGGPGYTIPAEILPENVHIRGAVAAARLGGPSNPTKASSGSQFYIVTGRNVTDAELTAIVSRGNASYTEEQKTEYIEKGGYPGLDGDYTVFGRVISGMEIADKIGSVARNGANRPDENVTMKIRMK